MKEHMEHFEDILFCGSTAMIGDFLGDIPEGIWSEKIDGAPAIAAGICPDTGKFFVGTKAALSKTPLRYYSAREIRNNPGMHPGLAEKLVLAFMCLEGNIENGWAVGDMLWDKYAIKLEVIGHTKIGNPILVYEYRPNVIKYQVPVDHFRDCESGRKPPILGMYWHTFVGDVTINDDTQTCWHEYANHRRTLIGTRDKIRDIIRNGGIGSISEEAMAFAKYMSADIKTFYNYTIKFDVDVEGDDWLHLITQYMTERHNNFVTKLKTPLGITNREQRFAADMANVKRHIHAIMTTYANLIRVKHSIINTLEDVFADDLNTAYVERRHNVENPGERTPILSEGFVCALSKTRRYKFIRRQEFSRYNFSDEYVKGWSNE